MQRISNTVAEVWKRLLVRLGLRQRDQTPVEKLCHLIVLNGRSKAASWIDISLRPDSDSIVEVIFGDKGQRVLEMTPPRPLLEPIADFFEDWCSVAEDFADVPTFRGAVTLVRGDEVLVRVRANVRRPTDAPSSVFLELYDAAGSDDGEEDDDAIGGSRRVNAGGSSA